MAIAFLLFTDCFSSSAIVLQSSSFEVVRSHQIPHFLYCTIALKI
ncbi:hypothetical protein ACE1B6_21545 [Aerosakkonemataceae cyanobacterium BLCC-F154]|uniref:Uncharacterized protein n=1 Tax=Floridaenema fluviatile BLCC-F154 TaxID=3153640 RepID=A0ABV4YGG1_9CYAN